MVTTTIRISSTNRVRLARIGKKDQTYDEIIEKLLDETESQVSNNGGRIIEK